jgi:hypothetical protein
MTKRRANGTWLPGHSPGKPRGTRNRLAERVFADALAHWDEIDATSGKRKGVIALELMFRERPAEYVRALSNLLPREFHQAAAELDLPDEELDELIHSMRRRLEEQRKVEQPVRLLPVKDPVQ